VAKRNRHVDRPDWRAWWLDLRRRADAIRSNVNDSSFPRFRGDPADRVQYYDYRSGERKVRSRAHVFQ
jgi:hypothetical protein